MKKGAIVLVIGPELPRDVMWGPWGAVSQNTQCGVVNINSFNVRGLALGRA